MKSNKKILRFLVLGLLLSFAFKKFKVAHVIHIGDVTRASIQKGLTKEEVESILGKPKLIQAQGKSWTYKPYLNFKDLTVDFDDQNKVRYTYELD